MTDPNVIEALRLLADRVFRNESSPQRDRVNALLAAERPAEKPAAPALPWVVRDLATGHIYATCSTRTNADNIRAFLGEWRCEVATAAPAPAIVPVKFDVSGDASGDSWRAHMIDHDEIDLTIRLRPGEDAGVTTAKILAACGRGP